MVGLGWIEVLILLVCAGMFIVIPTAVVISILIARQSSARTHTSLAHSPPPSPARSGGDDADIRQTIIARLTQRFCPQCRSPLAPDSPEGLCPACLMAGGLASAAVEPAVNGLA